MTPIEQLAAEQFAAQKPAEVVSGLFQPLIDIIKPAMGTVSTILGGIFGLYLIFVVARLYFEKRKVRLLKNINYDLDYLNQHFSLPYSQEKKVPKKVMSLEGYRRLMKEKGLKEKAKREMKAQKRQRFYLPFKSPISVKVKRRE